MHSACAEYYSRPEAGENHSCTQFANFLSANKACSSDNERIQIDPVKTVCRVSMQQVAEIGSVTSLQEIQAGLERLERRDWWRWAAALLIMLLLTLGMFALSLPDVAKDTFSQEQLSLTVRGLFALVLVFDFFAIYQQVRISGLRKQLSGQIGMHAALEALKSATPEEQAGKKESRRSPRYPFDQRLTVTATVGGKQTIIYGRTIDISEFGMGAVISGFLERGASVSVGFNTGAGDMRLTALVRFVHGFRHGFEFTGMSAAESQNFKQICQFAAADLPR